MSNANNVDPYQTPHVAAIDQGPHCMLLFMCY